jgi:RNA polymerase sigma-70 factor, ECF subfamily
MEEAEDTLLAPDFVDAGESHAYDPPLAEVGMAGASDELSQTISLIRKAREGDAAAVDRLFDRYSRVAVECARRLAGDALKRKEEVEDLAQSALVEVWRDFGRFDYRGIGSLDRFVREVVKHKVMKKAEYWGAQRRDAARERLIRTAGDDSTETKRVEPPEDPLTTTQVVTRHETEDRIRRAIDRLPEEHAIPLRLSDLEGLSHKEVAEKLSLPSADAARMRVQRARDALRKILEGDKGG